MISHFIPGKQLPDSGNHFSTAPITWGVKVIGAISQLFLASCLPGTGEMAYPDKGLVTN